MRNGEVFWVEKLGASDRWDTFLFIIISVGMPLREKGDEVY